MANAIEQIYAQLNQVFGGTNPNQFFSLLMPGTNLDAASYAYDTSTDKPAIVQEAESRLVDQMFDIAAVTASSNGQRVSAQFIQALSVLTPKFDPMLPMLKKTLRDFLNTPMPANTMLDDEPFTGSLGEYYFKLYEGWIAAKLNWSTIILNKKKDLVNDPQQKEKFLEWYDEIAEGELAKIDEAMGKVLAAFSPSDMESILGALAAGPGGEVNEAINAVNDIRLASPDGGFFYPVDLTPDDWFKDLASDVNPVNLLDDPAFIAATINARRQALMASISQVQSLISKMPTQGQLAAAKDTFTKAQSTYSAAQNALLTTYADNAQIAADIYLSKYGQSPSTDADKNKALAEMNKSAADASKAKGENPIATGATKKNGSPITTADVKQIIDGQNKLIGAQSALLSGSQALADAGMTLANEQASTFSDAPVILSRLQSQLADIQDMQQQLGTSIQAAALAPPAPTLPTGAGLSQDDIDTINAAINTAAKTAMTAKNATADTVAAAIVAALALSTNPTRQPIADAANAAKATQSASSVALAVRNAADSGNYTGDSTTADAIATAGEAAAVLKGATAASVATAVAHAVPTGHTADYTALTTAASTASLATPQQVIDACSRAVSAMAKVSSKKSLSSDRFMELQMSFSNNEMNRNSSSNSSFSQTSWSVDLFFGSASGQDSQSQSTTTENDLDTDTQIQIGMKATKVDISRGWFNPGLFKISGDMNSLTSTPVSVGPVDILDPTKADAVKTANAALLPCFPVSFVIAKDINITFKTNYSSLDTIHSILDKKSAAGGGFLCFSVSSSSASHNESSSFHTKTIGNVINITIPGPQILGWFLEFTPIDKSDYLKTAAPSKDGELTIIDYVGKLEASETTSEVKATNGKLKTSEIKELATNGHVN